MKDRLRRQISDALQTCFANDTLHSGVAPEVQIEVPGNPEHGDFSSNLAMTMARAEKKSPRQIAEVLVAALCGCEFLSKVEIAGPGFINFTLMPTCWYEVLDDIAAKRSHYGFSQFGQGRKVQVEFVSANPTGPLHIGHGRGAAVGDAVASILQAAGFDVQREYYVNDAGNQVATLGRSIWMRLREQNGETVVFPEDGYQGEYIRDLAAKLIEEDPSVTALEEEEAVKRCTAFGVNNVLVWIAADLKDFGITFDKWFSEQSLFDRNMVKQTSKTSALHLISGSANRVFLIGTWSTMSSPSWPTRDFPTSKMAPSGCAPPITVTTRTGF